MTVTLKLFFLWWGCSGAQPAHGPQKHRLLCWAVQLWVATEPVNQGNEAENFDAAVKTTVEKERCSGRTEVPGNIPRRGQWPPQGWEELTEVNKWCHHLLQEKGIFFILGNTGEERCPGTERSLITRSIKRCSQQQFRPRLFLRIAFHFWNRFLGKRASQVYVHCTPLTPGFLQLCKLQGKRTFLFPVEILSLMINTKHSLSCPVSSSFISTSEAGGFTSDSLSVTYMLSSDFETNGPSHKCPKGKKRCTAVGIAETQGSVTLIL